ncbi:MAG: hypothetical protein HQL15_04800 [Candidatus Omnitrophica bacterium]|nr:hypothetical protein [Candidatus Omnitrophota bacterium]
MILIFVLMILVAAILVLIYMLAPQIFPWYRPHLILNSSEMQSIRVQRRPMVMEGLIDHEFERNVDMNAEDKVARLETILVEKNRSIEKLQKQLMAEKAHRQEFENLRMLLDEEIQNLRNQNKELKNKIGVSHV